MRWPKPDLDCCTTEKNISLIARNRDSSVNTVIWVQDEKVTNQVSIPSRRTDIFYFTAFCLAPIAGSLLRIKQPRRKAGQSLLFASRLEYRELQLASPYFVACCLIKHIDKSPLLYYSKYYLWPIRNIQQSVLPKTGINMFFRFGSDKSVAKLCRNMKRIM